jgi:hypothetical protein
MAAGSSEKDLLDLSSTYSILTAERILARFNIRLKHDDLMGVMRHQDSVYFQLLMVPFKNIINGIIIQQAYDYQVYAQKLFIDYLVSGEGNTDEEVDAEKPGANIREDLEVQRQNLVNLAEQFEKDNFAHKTLIHQSQSELSKISSQLQPIDDPKEHVEDVAQAIAPLLEKADNLSIMFRQYRVEFKSLILATLRLVQLLPDYHANEIQDNVNRETLHFDDQIG